MRICHVIANLETGGAENHLRALTEGQKILGIDVRIIVTNYLDLTYVDTFSPKVKIYDFSRVFILKKAVLLRKTFKEDEIQLVHAHLPKAEIFVSIATFGMRIAKIATRHVTGNYSQRWRGNYLLVLSKIVLRRFDFVIAISNAVAKSIMDREKIDPKRIKVIPYGFQKRNNNPEPPSANIVRNRSEEFKMVSVMRLEKQKRPIDILEGFKKFSDEVKNVKLDIYGDGSLRKVVAGHIVARGLCEKVTLKGRVTDVASKLREYDAFILASGYEGFGLVYLEAISSLLPIISSRNEAALEMFDNQSCIFFEVGDVHGMAKCFDYLFHNFDEVFRNIQEKYPILLKKYNLSRMIYETNLIYESLL